MRFVYFKIDNDDYICKECKFTTPNQNTMHYHYKSHLEKKEFKCKSCNKEFITKRSLELHCTAKHGKSKELYCCNYDGCEFENITKGNCRIHWVRMHCKPQISKILEQDENGYNCLKCEKTFKGATIYYYHAFECLNLQNTEYCRLTVQPTV
jgi:hypothetical protein